MAADDQDEERDSARVHVVPILRAALQQLGYDASDPLALATRLVMERELAVSVLRRVCHAHGDNNWPDDLHLADVIEKYLERYLDD